MKRLIFALSLMFLIGLFALSWHGPNAYASNSFSGKLQAANHATYKAVDWVDYYYGPPYYSYYPYYYSGPGFYINTPFFGFSIP